MTVEAIEAASAVAWPATESTTLGEWTLFAGGGFSRRRNSAVPAGPAPEDLERRLAEVAEWYRVRALPTLFRINPLCDPDVDTVLADCGFSIEAPTLVMCRSIEDGRPVRDVIEAPAATDEWVSAGKSALGIEPALVPSWLATLARVPGPAVFAMPTADGAPVGAAFGVAVGTYLGVFEVAVEASHRRKGHATRTMEALHHFGVRCGATTAFLQVLENDDRAISMYRSLGYEFSHRYWYRRRRHAARM
jgi:ribosomal protein S18 acetylase RimI-like enzyme